ncbi:sodium/potassium/calcium exchanger 2-like [Periophthalmus magnuspinnatus]|uniref:sodium/potassium/calcium exchanger 2-like n=1 Tax=Periophthalmus magnuspinnatus TaxID=409849 RepID=UPI00145A748B|nr:sodium/potassium/calcium exchanger 2-like [Periophthalmus magnuspinnatus]
MKWKPKCCFLYAMFLCVFGAGSNEVITESPHKSPDEDDTSIQELHPPSAQTTAQTTRETNFLRDLDTQQEDSTTNAPHPTTILQIHFKTTESSTLAPPTTETPKGMEKFPLDVFSLEERKRGWVLLHITGVLYMFVSLVILLEEFFVPALRVITDIFALSNSVGGATIMAAASSTPRFFASFMGLFLSGEKAGINSIVGSAVFNIMFVIGMCALFSREMLHLTWWPLFRDMSFYIMDLILLIVFFLDNVIVWWESLMLVGGYSLYLVFMKFNVQIERFVRGLLHKHRSTVIAMNEHGKETVGDGSDEASRNHNGSHKDIRRSASHPEEAESRAELVNESSPLSLRWPGSRCGRGLYLLRLPALLPLWLTLPDVRKQESRKFVVLSLLGSLVWMNVFLYLIVWWAHTVAEAVFVPEHIMDQLTAQVNLPVLITALIAARRGLTDTPTSIALGSNIYEITLGLPVSWLVFSAVRGWAALDVSSTGLTCFISLFSLALLIFIVSFASCKLKIRRMLGFTLVLLYCLMFLLSAMLKHQDVFREFCERLSA